MGDNELHENFDETSRRHLKSWRNFSPKTQIEILKIENQRYPPSVKDHFQSYDTRTFLDFMFDERFVRLNNLCAQSNLGN